MKFAMAAAGLVMALGINAVYGKECAGVFFPDHAEFRGTLLILNGLGVRKASVFNVSVYVSALYLTKPSSDPHLILQSDTPSELILEFVRKLSAHQIRKSWETGFARNFPGHPPGLEAGLAQLNSWVTDMQPGQRMTFIRIPGTGMQVDIDATVKGVIVGDEFSRAFLSIWFGEYPQTPELKRGLLGGPCE